MARTNVEEQQSPAFVNERKNVTGKQLWAEIGQAWLATLWVIGTKEMGIRSGKLEAGSAVNLL